MSAPPDDLAQQYAAHGFAGRLGFGERPAVLAVDIAMAYLDKDSPLYAGVEVAVEAAGRVIGAARAAGVPVLHTRVRFAPGGADGGLGDGERPLFLGARIQVLRAHHDRGAEDVSNRMSKVMSQIP